MRAGELLRTAARILGYQIAFGFIGFMVTPALIGAAPAVRISLIGVFILAMAILMFMDGSYRGEKDCALGETLDRLERKGAYTASAVENGKRYSRLKGVLSALLSALPLLLIALFVALTAQPYMYTLQDLPGWLSPYLDRAEIGKALVYLEDVGTTATVTDYCRIVVRFVLFPYVGLFGTMDDAASLLFDRIAPALTLIMPVMTAIGYQFGPRRRAKAVKEIEKAKNTPRKRLKKQGQKKQGEPKEKKQLI